MSAGGQLAVAAGFGAGRIAYDVLTGLGRDGGDAGVLPSVPHTLVLVWALVMVVLAGRVRRGGFRAWVTSLALLPFSLLLGVLLLVTAVRDGDVPVSGGGVVVASVAALLLLTVPRSVRGYFTLREPAPHAGTVPGHPARH